jgi:hypothetical protein
MLNGKALIVNHTDPSEAVLGMKNIETVSGFFGIYSDEGVRALHASLRAFVNTSSESIEGLLKLRK